MGLPVARPEREIQRAILDYLRLLGIPAWRNNSGAFRLDGQRWFRAGVKGGADILGILPPDGRLLAIEVKRPTGRLTREQAVFLDTVAQAGGLALVARSCDEVRAALSRWRPDLSRA